MPDAEWMDAKVREALPDAEVTVTDLTGAGDHFHLLVIDASFEGIRLLQRQKTILTPFRPFIPKVVHALDLKALTPEEAETADVTVFHPHGGGQGVHFKAITKRRQNEE